MSEKKYCRMRRSDTKDEVGVAEDWFDSVHMIRHFYAKENDRLFNEVAIQTCKDEENFELIWNDMINVYKDKGWEVIE